LLSYKPYSNAMMRRVGNSVLAQRAPAAEKEQRASSRTKPLSSIPEPSLDGDGMTGAPVIELEYKHACHAVLEEVNMATY
jgi:hypothetical protein